MVETTPAGGRAIAHTPFAYTCSPRLAASTADMRLFLVLQYR